MVRPCQRKPSGAHTSKARSVITHSLSARAGRWCPGGRNIDIYPRRFCIRGSVGVKSISAIWPDCTSSRSHGSQACLISHCPRLSNGDVRCPSGVHGEFRSSSNRFGASAIALPSVHLPQEGTPDMKPEGASITGLKLVLQLLGEDRAVTAVQISLVPTPVK